MKRISALIAAIFISTIPIINIHANNEILAEKIVKEIEIGETSSEIKEATKIPSPNTYNTPEIKSVEVIGQLNPSQKGLDYYKDIEIKITSDKLTKENLLTKEGLHWSDDTYVELINGEQIDQIEQGFGFIDIKNEPTPIYSSEIGTSGRINKVGKTISGQELDLIWTITDSNKNEWEQNSNYKNNTYPKGILFTGEQNIQNATGNSIVIVYNNASNIEINYQIVKHKTFQQIPVLVSFILTDIDLAQGVETNLSNILEIIPEESNLEKQDNIIYDKNNTIYNLNGSIDIPKGSYMGAAYLSEFNYKFYSTAPQREKTENKYPKSARYDIFGSSLQANLTTKISQNITINHIDENNNKLIEEEYYTAYSDERYKFTSKQIPKYQITDIQKEEKDNNINIKFIYKQTEEIYTSTNNNSYQDDEENKSITNIINENKEDKNTNIKTDNNKVDNNSSEKGNVNNNNFDKTEKLANNTTNSNSKTTRYNSIGITKSDINKYKSNNNTSINKNNSITNTTIIKNINNIIPKTNYNSYTKEYINNLEKENNKIEETDNFLINTNMTKKQKEDFLRYINEVAEISKEKHGSDIGSINHDIANAIAYSTYHKDKLQRISNDFGQKPRNLDKKVSDLFVELHEEEKYPIDFPHLAMSLATAEASDPLREIAKMVATMTFYNEFGESHRDRFLMLNSMTGDFLTDIQEKDIRTNIDAYILKYHPLYKDLQLNKRIEKYYNTKNLNENRERLYNDILRERAKGNSIEDYKKVIYAGSTLTLAGWHLRRTNKNRKYKALNKDHENFLKDMKSKKIFDKEFRKNYRINMMKHNFNEFDKKLKNTINFTNKKIIKPITSKVKDTVKKTIDSTKKIVENIKKNNLGNSNKTKGQNPKSITKNVNRLNENKTTTNTKSNTSKQTQIKDSKKQIKSEVKTSKQTTKKQNVVQNNKSNIIQKTKEKIKPVIEKVKKAVRRK